MSWTLDNALQECARNTYNTKTMIRNAGGYSGKGLEYADRFLSGINYAINKICREKMGVSASQQITLDDKGMFLISSLTKACVRVNSILMNSSRIDYSIGAGERVYIAGCENAVVDVLYEGIPDEMGLEDLDTSIPTDSRYVDPRVLCQYANYQFLSEEGTEYDSARAQVWLGLFNDSFVNIIATNRLPRRVRYTS